MYPQSHFLFSFFVGMIFVKFGFFDYRIALLIGFVGLLIDMDHYITFLVKYKYRDLKFKDSWNRAVKGVYAGRGFIHHELGIILISIVLLMLYDFNMTLFWVFALGYYSHIFLDYAHLNILKIKTRITFRAAGLVEKINKFEILFDIFLIFGIILLFF